MDWMSWLLKSATKPLWDSFAGHARPKIDAQLGKAEKIGERIIEAIWPSHSPECHIGKPVDPVKELGLTDIGYRRYTEDIIQDLLWSWSWLETSDGKSRIDLISELKCMCPNCRLRIEPKTDLSGRTETFPVGRDAYGRPRNHQMGVADEHSRFQCDSGHVDFKFPESPLSVLARIRRTVEQRSENAAEWPLATERINDARLNQ